MEFPNLGKHCSYPECGLLDFLPFTCDGCSKVFCADHRVLETHDCPSFVPSACTVIPCPICFVDIGVPPKQDPNTIIEKHITSDCAGSAKAQKKRESEHRCSLPRCKVVELIPFICTLCNHRFCTSHRHPSDHKCGNHQQSTSSSSSASSATVITAGGVGTAPITSSTTTTTTTPVISDKMRTIMDQYASQVYRTEDARRRAEQLRNARLRHLAKGSAIVPQPNRFYLEVVFPLNKKLPSTIMFFDERWTVGKALDEITEAGKIDNRNHIPGEEKWQVFSLDSGEALPTSVKLRDLRIAQFSAVLLEKPSALAH